MKNYRIYSLDDDGRTRCAYAVHCTDDLEAVSVGEKLSGKDPLEIWEDVRLVARVKHGARIGADATFL